MRRLFNFVVSLVCIVMFLLPVAGMIVHAAAVNEAEREWQKELKRMDRTVREAKR